MVVNRKNTDSPSSRVKFISYNGEYPNLCSGVLVLEIDGKEVKFGHNYNMFDWHSNGYKDENLNNPNYPSFWHSGGRVYADDDWNWTVEDGDWEIDCDNLDPKFWDLADEIDRVINENIPHGCCGGCI